MAEEAEGGKQSARSRFLSKSKWGKVFKENDSPPASGKASSFKLNDDVTDFLKPSTDRAASTRPKINIAVAQRWPEAHEVKRAHEHQGAETPVNGWTKPRRREGLAVGFVRTAPEVIGEGGDEAPDPPREVSRMKSRMARSASDGRPLDLQQARPPPQPASRPAQYGSDPRQYGGPDDEWGGQGSGQHRAPLRPDYQQQGEATWQDPRTGGLPDHGSRPPPVRRAQTNSEFSPSLQRKHQSPPLEPVLPHRPSLGRTPTGLPEESERQYSPSDNGLHHALPASRPTIRTSFDDPNELALHDSGMGTAQPQKRGKYGMLSPSSASAASPALLRPRDMTNNEGMALRRASAIYSNGESPVRDYNEGFQPPADYYDTLSQSQADALAIPDDSSSESARSPLGNSPFADPKYLERKSQEAASDAKRASDGSSLYTASVQSSTSDADPPPFRNADYKQHRPIDLPVASRPDPLAMLEFDAIIPEAQGQVQPHRQQRQLPFESLRQQRKNDYQPSYMRGVRHEKPQASARPSQDTSAKDAQATQQASHVQAAQGNLNGAEGTSPTRFDPGELSEMRTMPPPSGSGRAAPGSSGTIVDIADDGPRVPTCSSLRDRLLGSESDGVQDQSSMMYSQPGQSGGSLHQLPRSPASRSPAASHSFDSSQDARQLDRAERANAAHQTSPSPLYQTSSAGSQDTSPQSLMPRPNAARKGERSRSPLQASLPPASPADYFTTSESYQGQPAKSPMLNLRNEETARPGSAASGHRPSSSAGTLARSDPAADLALADFAARVAHMKGVFALTAEKERRGDQSTPEAWLRTAVWWYLRGKAGLETLLAQRSKTGEPQREMLMQPHVDLAKAYWIITGPLERYDMTEVGSPLSARFGDSQEEVMQQSVTLLMSYLKSLSASIQKSQLMPPHQSLIQGQDTTIWLDYPRFTADAADALGGSMSKGLIVESSNTTPNALDVLPLGDKKDAFCYSRFPVEVSVNTDDVDTDRVILPCIVTMIRHRRDYQTSLLISSQNELVNIKIAPKQSGNKGTTWSDVSWKASSSMIVVHLPRNFDLAIRMQERDFRTLWNLAEYSRKVESSLRPDRDEKLVHEARLTELQYADSSGMSSFPQDKVRTCTALLYERHTEHSDGSGTRKLHRGFRLLLVTTPGHKSLSCASHEVCRYSPLLFEFITDPSANGTTAMVLRIREEKRQCRILLVFPDAASRNAFYEVLNGLTVGPDETIVAKVNSAGVNIEPATQMEGFTPISHPALHALQWQRLGVTNNSSDVLDIPETVESESLRIIARHAGGCITDRLNMGKGELLLRLPCSDKVRPSVQMLREPQKDLTMSVDTRQCPQHVVDGITELLRLAQEQQTIRTYAFANNDDLHAFQAAVTGYTVKYDGIASTFAISRRMMVVSIHHKLSASNVRLQIVTQSNTTKILAFMEDFVHADALCFEVKSMDTFESVKGDSKGKKWAIKLKEAKFSLPSKDSKEKGELPIEEKVRRRFVNLEGLDYAEEHDDITVGFETEDDRDAFAKTLPAATSTSRGMSLRRRI